MSRKVITIIKGAVFGPPRIYMRKSRVWQAGFIFSATNMNNSE